LFIKYFELITSIHKLIFCIFRIFNQNELKSDKICINTQKNCVLRIPFENINFPVICPCRKPFQVKCSTDYCTKDLKSCIQLGLFMKSSNKITSPSIKLCSSGSNKVFFYAVIFKIFIKLYYLLTL